MMRTTIEMAREAAADDWGLFQEFMPEIHRLAELVRADERNSWPAEMEAMERQVNILTDALAQRTWVGLTDEEKRQLFDREDYQGWLDYINAIEAKLKEKNT